MIDLLGRLESINQSINQQSINQPSNQPSKLPTTQNNWKQKKNFGALCQQTVFVC